MINIKNCLQISVQKLRSINRVLGGENSLGPVMNTILGKPEAPRLTDEEKEQKAEYQPYALSNIVDILMGSLNFCALAFLSCGILYTFGVGALTTAHEGKKLGGSIYNSLWVPVRAAMSFSMCVPVTHGYSLLQIAIFTMVGFGINFGNICWDTAGKYLVDINAGITSNSPSSSVRYESRALMEPLFRNSVVFAIVTESQNEKLKEPKIKETEHIRVSTPSPFVIIDNELTGTITVQLWPAGESNNLEDFGTVVIPRPKIEELNKSKSKDDNAVYYAKLRIANTRLNAVVSLWRSIFPLAYKYAHEKHGAIPQSGKEGDGNGIELGSTDTKKCNCQC